MSRLSVRLVVVTLVLSKCALAQVSEPPAAPRFDIERFVVEGNTLLPAQEVERIVAPFAGKGRDFGDVQRALEALQDAYLKAGYNAVRVLVPEQDIRASRVRLQVIEAHIASIRVTGNRYFDAGNIRASLPVLKEGTAPNVHAIGEGAQLANESPVKQVAVVLEASQTPEQVDATVRVTDDDPSKFNVFVDNTGNSSTGYYRTGVGYLNGNLFNRDHVLNVQYITSPTDVRDVTIAGLGYRIPVYSWQGAVDAYVGYSNVNSGTVQGLFAVSGAGSIYGMRYTQFLPRINNYDQKLALGWDYRDYHNDVQFIGTSGTIVPDVTVQPLSLTYSGRVSKVGRDLSFYVTGVENLPGGTDGSQPAFDAQRFGAAAHYSIWRAGIAFSQALPGDYLLRFAVNGQYTHDLLIAGEQFGMGGVDSVRGFFERETANDVGNRFSAEAYTPDFGSHVGSNWRSRALAFADMANGHDNSPPQNPNNSLGSVGIGLRMNEGKALAVRLDWAYVYDGAGTRPTGSNRLHFAVSYTF